MCAAETSFTFQIQCHIYYISALSFLVSLYTGYSRTSELFT